MKFSTAISTLLALLPALLAKGASFPVNTYDLTYTSIADDLPSAAFLRTEAIPEGFATVLTDTPTKFYAWFSTSTPAERLNMVCPLQHYHAVLVPNTDLSLMFLKYKLEWRNDSVPLPDGSIVGAFSFDIPQLPDVKLTTTKAGPGSWQGYFFKNNTMLAVGWFEQQSEIGFPIEIPLSAPSDNTC